MASGNPHPYRSKEWEQYNAEEIASRPTAILNRKPFTPAELDALRPKHVQEALAQQQVPNDGAAR
ncbi:MAG TPA: hypothetical protein VE377_09125 [Candidatus Dormibacteraeota bacterium]|nr:hypothetical protein [Candidatus Dormibacteraeota bacterium]